MKWRLAVAVLCGVFGVFAEAGARAAYAASPPDACSLLTPEDIANATGLKAENGMAEKPIPGILGKCTWLGNGNTKVIVTLGDAQHMSLTIEAEEPGGESVSGLGTKAVGAKGAGFTGGGYIVTVPDGKGGFGVSILGNDGTRERAVALAKTVESHR